MLIIKYIRTGVDRYKSGSWNIVAGYEDADFAEYVAEQEDVQWLKAVTLMRMGKWWQARRVLKDIASSDSYYREEAQAVLDALYVF